MLGGLGGWGWNGRSEIRVLDVGFRKDMKGQIYVFALVIQERPLYLVRTSVWGPQAIFIL